MIPLCFCAPPEDSRSRGGSEARVLQYTHVTVRYTTVYRVCGCRDRVGWGYPVGPSWSLCLRGSGHSVTLWKRVRPISEAVEATAIG